MGNEAPTCIYMPPNFSYFAMQFACDNRLRFISAPVDVINSCKAVVSTYWSIVDEFESPSFYELELGGEPWYATSVTELVVKYFICALLKQFYQLGWHFKTSTDLQRQNHDSSVLIFERTSTLSTYVICLSLNEPDLIKVLAPEDLIPSLRQTILSFWPNGIQNEKSYTNVFEFKLKGSPWKTSESNKDSYFSVALINGIFSTLYQQGWVFIAAIDSGKRQFDINSLYFKYDPVVMENRNVLSSNFFAISLNDTDRIRLINAPNSLILKIKSYLPDVWKKGIQEEKNKYGAYVFKLKGNPWYSSFEETVDSRKLIGGLLSLLIENNWNLYATCDLTCNITSKSTFFFRWNEPVNLNSYQSVCISLNDINKIRLIGMSQSSIKIIRNCITQTWSAGIQNECDYYGSWQFELGKNPFSCSENNPKSIYTCLMMLLIMAAIEEQGLRFYSSADLSSKYELKKHNNTTEVFSADLDSWFFLDKQTK